MPDDTSAAASTVRPPGRLVRLGLGEVLGVTGRVALPTLAKGPLIRRPRMVALAERLELDTGAVRHLATLRARHGRGPVVVSLPGRPQVLLLDAAHVRRVLVEEPDAFHPSTAEKRSALAHFEPEVSLISRGADRPLRRDFNRQVLEAGRPEHSLAAAMRPRIAEEAARMVERAGGTLDWPDFVAGWNRLVRRLVLGDAAAGDARLTRGLATLRRRGNLGFLRRRRETLRAEVLAAIGAHLDRAEPGSLAAAVAAAPQTERTRPADQVAHYLFASDPAGMTAFRALALLAAHPGALDRARAEEPFLRATILETLRLWPTTPLILRETTRETDWGGGTLPRGAHVAIHTPFFCRDPMHDFADRFTPDLWLDGAGGFRDGATEAGLALSPFSEGEARCPAADFVPFVTAALLAAIVGLRTPALVDPSRLPADRPMPGTLDPYTLRVRLDPAPSEGPSRGNVS